MPSPLPGPLKALCVHADTQERRLIVQALAQAPRPISADVVDQWQAAKKAFDLDPTAYAWLLLEGSLCQNHYQELIEPLRQLQAQLAVIAITDSSDAALIWQALEHGVDDYLVKGVGYHANLAATLYAARQRRTRPPPPLNSRLRLLWLQRDEAPGSGLAARASLDEQRFEVERISVQDGRLQQLRVRHAYDLIVLADAYPRMETISLVKHIRRDLESAIPVVLLASQADHRLVAVAQGLGADGAYLLDAPDRADFAQFLQTLWLQSELLRERAQRRESEGEVLRLTQQVPGVMTVTRYRLGSHQVTTPFASKAIEDIFELTHEQVRDDGALFDQRVHPDDRTRVTAQLTKSLSELTPTICDYRLVLPNKGERWVESQVTPQAQVDGSIRLYSYTFDITDRKTSEDLLIQSEAQLRKLTQHVTGTIVVTQHRKGQATTLYASDSLGDMFELDLEVLRNEARLFAMRVHPDDLAMVDEHYRKVIKQRSRIVLEYRLVSPTRGLRWVEWQATPEPQDDGSLIMYSYTFDITERKKYAQAVLTAETALRANRAKSDFLSHMSHELRTPLNAILGFAELLQLQAPALGEAQLRKVKMIETAGQHLLDMITDVLDLSRIESDNLALSLEPIYLPAVIKESAAIVTASAKQAGIDLQIPSLDHDFFTLADPIRLKQVLVNLLSNAIKYNRPSGTVSLSVQRSDANIEICVSDTGKGMSAEQQSHLFEAFNRLGAERTDVEGTGIGLVIVQKLVSLMNGQLIVSSELGIGSRFVVRLPIAPDPATRKPAQAQPKAKEPSGKFSLLYVEDNEVNIEVLRQCMSLVPDCLFSVARSGEQALKMAQDSPPDLFLIDMHLSDTDGLSFKRELDRDVALQGIPCIALSADAMPEQIQQAQELGYKAYITKPFKITELLACIQSHLKN